MNREKNEIPLFFKGGAAVSALSRLTGGIRVGLHIEGRAYTLTKSGNEAIVTEGAPSEPDLSFFLPEAAWQEIHKKRDHSIGDISIALLKLMVDSDPSRRVRAKVHVGVLTLLGKGYLSVLSLGGPTVMKFMAERGMGSLSKIKDALARMREKG